MKVSTDKGIIDIEELRDLVLEEAREHIRTVLRKERLDFVDCIRQAILDLNKDTQVFQLIIDNRIKATIQKLIEERITPNLTVKVSLKDTVNE